MRLFCLVAMLLTTLGTSAVRAQTMPALSPEALSDLVPRWWRWRVALPALALPDKDKAGHFCDVGQSGGTWFLAGLLTFGTAPGPMRRACVMPAGRRLFFPLVTLMRVVQGDITCAKAQAQVSGGIDKADKMVATLDGTNLLTSTPARWGSSATCVALNLPADGPSSKLTAAVDGYWLSLGPLPLGHHTLVYGASLPANHDQNDIAQSTTYELEVQ